MMPVSNAVIAASGCFTEEVWKLGCFAGTNGRLVAFLRFDLKAFVARFTDTRRLL